MQFLKNLERLLQLNDMKKSDLAKKVGISQPTINAWYTKGYENVSLSTLIKISKLFNISLEELINGEIKTISFSSEEYSFEELDAIVNFSVFLKSTRKDK